MRTAIALLLLPSLAFSADEVDTPSSPRKSDDRTPKGNAAKDTAENAMKSFAVAPGLKVDVWAAEPLLENPVAFSFDHLGRAFVAETHRRRTSVPDIRKWESWQIENFSLRTVADRIAFMKAKLPESPALKPKKTEDDINGDGQLDWRDWAVESEKVRLVEDGTGKGRADKSRVLAEGFNQLETGLGAGVLAMPDGGAIYTCAPDLWRIAPDGTKTKLATGFGVHVAFGGHDMHGVKMGPDGRVYFTIADCGAHVTSKDGRVISVPDSGAVFRCWPDGDALELYAWGLRNPQSLAFNDVGDLFTCDNNADGGDKARWIHVIEGADYGWRIGWQFLPKLGAWNSEGMWHLDAAETNAAILPPVAHITHGPAGISYYPGTGLPEKYRGHFFVADFPGGVRHFALKQKGAGYEVDGMAGDDPILQNNSPSEMRGKLLWNLYPSDVQFPPGGGVCVLDWVYGWEKTGKGRIYRVHDPATDVSDPVQETKRVLAEDFSKRGADDLTELLGHADQRVRLKAQFALVEREGSRAMLEKVATGPGPRVARLHALWGLGQLARKSPDLLASCTAQTVLDKDPEVRAQTWRVLAAGAPAAAVWNQLVIAALKAPEARVRFFAAQATARLKPADATNAIFAAMKADADGDKLFRHALVTALTKCASPAQLAAMESNASESIRLGVLLALRRTKSTELVNFLHDASPRLRLEAARAIHDAPIPSAIGKLAALDLGAVGLAPAAPRITREPAGTTGAQRPQEAPRASKARSTDTLAAPTRAAMFGSAFTRRVINASYRLGDAECARRLAAIAARTALDSTVRLDALNALAQWPVKLGRDRVLGIVVEGDGTRNAADGASALETHLPVLLADKADAIRIAALNAVGANRPAASAGLVTAVATDKTASGEVRAAALQALAAMNAPQLADVVTAALDSGSAPLVEAARRLAGKVSPELALKANADVLGKGSTREQQEALASIAATPGPNADAVLAKQFDLLLAGKLKPGIILDLLEAAAKRDSSALKEKAAAYEAARKADDPLARWRECLEGGDGKAGKKVFAEKSEAACMRCHKVKGDGGDVGPDLADTGKKMGREYLLRAIVDPNSEIAKGYDNVMVTLADGNIVAGLAASESATELALKNPADGKLQRVKKAAIKERMSLPSAMPPGLGEILTKRELRDLVQYLATLR